MRQNLPESFQENIFEAFGDDAKQWLEDLPTLLQSYEGRWGIELEETPVDNLTCNLVIYGRRGPEDVVLKIGVSNDIATEMVALKTFEGRGTVECLETDFEGNTVLIRRVLPGTPLEDVGNRRQIDEIAASFMQNVPVPMLSESRVGLFDRWMEGIFDRHNGLGSRSPMAADLVDRARMAMSELEAEQMRSLIHKDIHDGNILASESGWVLIDPQGVLAHPHIEYGTYFSYANYGDLTEDVRRTRIASALDTICDTTPIPRSRLRDVGLINAIFWTGAGLAGWDGSDWSARNDIARIWADPDL